MKPPSLSALRKGDVLILRDGTRRTFQDYSIGGAIYASGVKEPCSWFNDGQCFDDGPSPLDIVRVVRAKVKKVRIG